MKLYPIKLNSREKNNVEKNSRNVTFCFASAINFVRIASHLRRFSVEY